MVQRKRKLWGAHRRRHIRNETLTIVWNYTVNTVKHWWEKTTGGEHDASAIIQQYRPGTLIEWWSGSTNTDDATTTTTTDVEEGRAVEMKEIKSSQRQQQQAQEEQERDSMRTEQAQAQARPLKQELQDNVVFAMNHYGRKPVEDPCTGPNLLYM